MKKVAIVQSNYIPWKGYFDMIAAVDEFILFDETQFTKNDWRNRNKIKTPKGVEWLSVPVGKDIKRRVCDVTLPDPRWQQNHWKTLANNYGRAPHFSEIAKIFEPLYLDRVYGHLSELNLQFIRTVCACLGITTRISSASEYTRTDGKTERLVDLCQQVGAQEYISGPLARNYIEERFFSERGILVTWFDYKGYPEYPQLWGSFVHEVSVLDLLFNCGSESQNYMKFAVKK